MVEAFVWFLLEVNADFSKVVRIVDGPFGSQHECQVSQKKNSSKTVNLACGRAKVGWK